MRRKLATVAAALAVLLAGPSPAGAQQADAEVVSVRDLPDGRVEATVALPDGAAGEVPPEAFSLTHDGAALPLEVQPLNEELLDVVLVIDTSGSMQGAPMAAAKAAASGFLQQLPGRARVAVVGFGSTPALASPMGSDRAQTAAAIEGLTATGETALYDAVQAAVVQFPAEGAGRRAVIILSDGGDTVSNSTIDDAVARLAASGADTFVIALATAESDGAVLERLAATSGGRVLGAGDPSALAPIYDRLASVLANPYRLTFSPTPGGSGEAVLTVAHLGATTELRLGFTPVAAPVVPADPGPEEPVAVDAAPVRLEPVTAPETAQVPEPGGLAGSLGLVVGLVSLSLALFALGLMMFLPERRRVRLPRAMHGMSSPSRSFDRLKERATDIADRALESKGRRRRLEAALDRAGVALRPAEFVVLAAVSAAGGFLLGVVLAGLAGGLVLAAVVLFGFRFALAHLAAKRRRLFEEQLPSTLQILAGSLRTGYAVQQAVETVATESESPTADEFHRLVTENRLGRDFGESLRAMADRIRTDDFDLVVRAIEIHRTVGGDLAEVLDNVAATVRDRNYLKRQVAALSAEGRISAYVLVALPIAVFFLMLAISPDYIRLLLERSGGRVMLLVAGSLMVAGWFWMRRLIRLRF